MRFLKAFSSKQNINSSVLFFAFLISYSVYFEMEIKPLIIFIFTILFSLLNAFSTFVQSIRSNHDFK
ncbi:hypothetical protein QOZ95_004470 [Paenibacillus brasilensis]|uniref:Uncharacterized protein n=1 Tax=Paenibacillus brasilensis TaxID=128574 RepID=A0ABU0L4V9_9BACL|nr:hypothetical protein [Paenibacillus brasilensis]